MEVLSLIFPVFAVIVTGFVFARFKILSDTVAGALTQFVFYIAIPALLFVIIAQQDIKDLFNLPFILAFGLVTYVVALLIFLGARMVFKADLEIATMVAMVSSVSNTGIIGLPLLHAIFGEKAVVLAALANIIVVVLLLVQVVLLESAKSAKSESAGSKLKPLIKALLNPVILSTVLGLAYAMTPLSLPSIAIGYLDMLGSALAPCALFAVGMSIKPAAVLKTGKVILFTTSAKLIVIPLVVLAVVLLMGLDPLLAVTAVIAGALPTAKNEFILAEQYHQSEEIAAETVSATTALAVVTLVGWLLILSHIFPDAYSLS